MLKNKFLSTLFGLGLLVVSLSSCQSVPNEDASSDLSALFGKTPDDIDQRIKKAAAFPLGSKDNPVRVMMPQGERDYLSHLRCQDGKMPQFDRLGSFGVGVFGHVIDGYDVTCANSEPAKSTIFMDMYFGQEETKAPPGFTYAQ